MVTNNIGATVQVSSPKFGGRYLVRGGEGTVLEGTEPLKRAVVIAFDSYERAIEFYNAPEYRAILPHRLENAETGRLISVRGT